MERQPSNSGAYDAAIRQNDAETLRRLKSESDAKWIAWNGFK